MSAGALADLRVIEIGSGVSAAFCARQLASLGAEVVKVEPPVAGDATRRSGPFFGDRPDPEGSGLFLYLNADKLGVTLDLARTRGRSILLELVREADILVENHLPREMGQMGLNHRRLKALNSGLIHTSITPFGQTGPYRDYKGSDLIGFHSGGLGSITPRPGAGLPDEGPLRMRGHFAEMLSGMNAAAGTLCALYERDLSGEGQHLDISMQETISLSVATNFANYSYQGNTVYREGSAPYQPVATMACKDGYVDIQCMTEEQWQRLVDLMGNPEWAEMEIFSDVFSRAENWDVLGPLITDWLMGMEKQAFYLQAQASGIPSAPVNTTADLVDSAHLADRQFLVALEHPSTGRLRYPGPFMKMSGTPAMMARRAPLLGEHNEAVYGDRMGYSRADLAELKTGGLKIGRASCRERV